MNSPSVRLQIDQKTPALQAFLLGRVKGLSKQQLDTLFYQGRVQLNGQAATPEQIPALGDVVELFQRDRRILPEALAVPVLHEDEQLLVVDKPAGMAVHPGLGTYGGTLLNWLAHHWAASGSEAVMAQAVVHRLDKATSGVLVLAKTRLAAQHLQQQFVAGSTERMYMARVWGAPQPAAGSIVLPIGRDPHNPQLIRVDASGSFGKMAHTDYETQWTDGRTSLLRLHPQTGRTHQLRVHLHHLGHGIVGDVRYRQPHLTDEVASASRLALHAAVLGFTHPESGDWCRFESALPAEF